MASDLTSLICELDYRVLVLRCVVDGLFVKGGVFLSCYSFMVGREHSEHGIFV